MSRLTRLAALGLVLCLVFSGCAAEDEPEPEAPSDPPAPVIVSQAPEIVRFSLGYDPAASLDPITGDSQVNQELTGLVYQYLYQLDNSFDPQPCLVSSAAVSEDGYTWTFTITPDVLFSDGTPLTAAHAAASLNAARSSPLYGTRLANIWSVSAADERTMVVGLTAPNGNLPALLDIPVALPQEEGPPLGSGYYRYEIAGERMFLQSNPYHPASAALPYTAIPLTAASAAAERIAAFDSGDVSAVTTDFTSPYSLGYSSSYETWDYPTTNLLYVGFRAAEGPCQYPLVRRAFSRAFDRAELAEVLLSGHADAAELPVSPLCGGWDEDAAALLRFDPEDAAALLDEAGYVLNEEDGLRWRYREPLEVTLVVNSDNDSRQAVADALAGALAGLGVTVTVERLSWNDYLAALQQGRFDLYIGETRLTGDFDPAALLTGALNYGGFEDWELTGALWNWQGAQGEARTQAARVLWEKFAQDAPFAPLCFKEGSMLVRWGLVSDLSPTRADPYFRMERWTMAG